MNEIQLAILQGFGHIFRGTEKRGTRYVAVAVKRRSDGKELRAEAGGSSPREAERNLILTFTRK